MGNLSSMDVGNVFDIFLVVWLTGLTVVVGYVVLKDRKSSPKFVDGKASTGPAADSMQAVISGLEQVNNSGLIAFLVKQEVEVMRQVENALEEMQKDSGLSDDEKGRLRRLGEGFVRTVAGKVNSTVVSAVGGTISGGLGPIKKLWGK